MLRALWKIDVYLISTPVNKSLYLLLFYFFKQNTAMYTIYVKWSIYIYISYIHRYLRSLSQTLLITSYFCVYNIYVTYFTGASSLVCLHLGQCHLISVSKQVTFTGKMTYLGYYQRATVKLSKQVIRKHFHVVRDLQQSSFAVRSH